MNSLDVNKVDWAKIFMGLSVALVFIMQQWHSIQMSDIKGTLVPRSEYTSYRETTMSREDILLLVREVEKRINEQHHSHSLDVNIHKGEHQ